jgi:hypothetical protein
MTFEVQDRLQSEIAVEQNIWRATRNVWSIMLYFNIHCEVKLDVGL